MIRRTTCFKCFLPVVRSVFAAVRLIWRWNDISAGSITVIIVTGVGSSVAVVCFAESLLRQRWCCYGFVFFACVVWTLLGIFTPCFDQGFVFAWLLLGNPSNSPLPASSLRGDISNCSRRPNDWTNLLRC